MDPRQALAHRGLAVGGETLLSRSGEVLDIAGSFCAMRPVQYRGS